MNLIKPKNDIALMRDALRISSLGRFTTTPNPHVGAIITKEGQVVGAGYHQVAGQDHAEIIAFKQAKGLAKAGTLYVTLEPCCHTGRTQPCTKAIIKAGIKKVFVAMLDPNPQVAGKGMAELREAGITCELLKGELTDGNHATSLHANLDHFQDDRLTDNKAPTDIDWLNTSCPTLSNLLTDKPPTLHAVAEQINAGFIKRMKTGRPWVQLKTACTLDGRIAMADGESQWITGEQARAQVQTLRLASCAILTSSKTLIKDNARLSVRPNQCAQPISRQPAVVILDSNLKCQPTLKVFDPVTPKRKVHIFTHNAQKNQTRRLNDLEQTGAQIHFVAKAASGQGLDLEEVFLKLGELELNRVLIEAGSHLSGELIQHDWVDELTLFIAPIAIGHNAMPLFNLPNIQKLSDKIQWTPTQIQTFGNDIQITFIPNS